MKTMSFDSPSTLFMMVFEALFKLGRGTWCRATNEREIQPKQRAVGQEAGHFAVGDALGKPSTIAVLPTPGSPISTGLFLVRRQRI